MTGFSDDYCPRCFEHWQNHALAATQTGCTAKRPAQVPAFDGYVLDLDDESEAVLEDGQVRDDELRREER